jgi:crotonobetainyl-CoA:carnitine CoA-transferase CaiB-like acyl-CoA transferase
MAGMYAATAILGALFERERTRVGQYIDLSLLDTQVAALANQGMSYLVSGRSPQRHGTAHPNIVPYQSFATADGYMMLAVGNDRQFASLCAVLGCAELPADERFATNPARVANRAALVVRLQTLLSQRATHEWLEKLTAARVPCGPISDIAQVFADSQVVRRGMRLELRHPSLGRVPSVKNPINFSHSSLEYERAPPLLGEHTEEILRERLGRSPEEVAKLRDSGAIGVR